MPSSWGIFAFTTLFIVVFNIGVMNYQFYFSMHGWKETIAVFLGTFSAILPQEVLILCILAVLTGLVVAFLVHYFRSLHEQNTAANLSGASITTGSSLGSLGALLSIAAPACPSCGIGLFSLLGYSGLLVLLPFKGKELGIIGIILLLTSIISLSNKISTKTCRIKQQK